jgi:hypothetical protein
MNWEIILLGTLLGSFLGGLSWDPRGPWRAPPQRRRQRRSLSAKAYQGHDGAQMIALQASHGLANDCGLCALKNVTVNDLSR